MDYADHIEATERAAGGFVDALRAGPVTANVPTCPDWQLTDLARHVGQFTGLWTHVLCEGTGRPKTPFRDAPEDAELADWCEENFGHLLSELRATPADTEVWTWVPDDHSAAFVGRRTTHELTVHRFDAQTARQQPQPIDPAVAADGIEEIFTMIQTWETAPGGPAGKGETLHLHGTDRADEWLLTLGADGLGVERRHAKGDLALRGAVSDLELLLYERPTIGEVERLGDTSVLDAWYRVFHFG